MTNVEKFIGALERSGKGFYHFTDERNLPSIRERGILSHDQATRLCEEVVKGGNQWSLDADARSGMDKYVHLCFFDQHPMEHLAKAEGRILQSRFLRIAPQIIETPGVLISLGVSNAAEADLGPVEQYIGRLDLEVIYKRTNWRDSVIMERLQAARKCELLVPAAVPVEFIRNI